MSGASIETLCRRINYDGKKGRSAKKRLGKLGFRRLRRSYFIEPAVDLIYGAPPS